MKKHEKTRRTGEITRSFIKHKVYATLWAIEGDDAGTVLACAVITEATACRHTLAGYALTLDSAEELNANLRDYEVFEPVCSDPKHLLEEIGVQERVCQQARGTMLVAQAGAKSAKETYEEEEQKLRAMVRDATNPSPLPLFDQPAARTSDDLPAGTYRDGVGALRCSVCFATHPCGIDHTVPPTTAADPNQPSA